MFGRDPNIAGDAGTFIYYALGDESFMYRGSRGINNRTCVEGTMDYHLLYDASKANSLYSGNDLQIPSLQTLVCIKV